jgi:hypothetical protein
LPPAPISLLKDGIWLSANLTLDDNTSAFIDEDGGFWYIWNYDEDEDDWYCPELDLWASESDLEDDFFDDEDSDYTADTISITIIDQCTAL